MTGQFLFSPWLFQTNPALSESFLRKQESIFVLPPAVILAHAGIHDQSLQAEIPRAPASHHAPSGAVCFTALFLIRAVISGWLSDQIDLKLEYGGIIGIGNDDIILTRRQIFDFHIETIGAQTGTLLEGMVGFDNGNPVVGYGKYNRKIPRATVAHRVVVSQLQGVGGVVLVGDAVGPQQRIRDCYAGIADTAAVVSDTNRRDIREDIVIVADTADYIGAFVIAAYDD
jgi:hypothetical protein